MTTPHPDDKMINALLDAARGAPPPVPSDLMARVLADAQGWQPKPRQAPRAAPGLWAMLSDLLGGRAALAGLGTAAAFGLMLGVLQPFDALLGEAAFDLLPQSDGLLALLDPGI